MGRTLVSVRAVLKPPLYRNGLKRVKLNPLPNAAGLRQYVARPPLMS